jgi:hypothetical protein
VSYIQTQDHAFVTDDGAWSQAAEVIIFDPNQLTEEQWITLDELPDSQKLSYVEAILNGAHDLTPWEGRDE